MLEFSTFWILPEEIVFVQKYGQGYEVFLRRNPTGKSIIVNYDKDVEILNRWLRISKLNIEGQNFDR